jgi:molybdopterin-guanine dinucleotide biosynthesis protein A
VSFAGAVLTGGASRRMGTDKALLNVDGRAMALRVADALWQAGADRVIAVGGDTEGLSGLGLEVVPDRHPGEGPLGAILTALAATTEDVVVVLACDLVDPDPEAIRATVAALGEADVAAPPGELLHAAYHRRAEAVLADAFAAGERAPRRAVAALHVVEVVGLSGEALADADDPEDLPRR